MFRRMLLAFVIACSFCLVSGGGQAPSERAPPRKDYHGDALPAGAVARFGTFRMRLAGKIADVAIAPGNRHIAVATSVFVAKTNHSRDRKGIIRRWDSITTKGVIRLWNLESGKTFRDFESVERGFKQIAFSADGKTLAGLHDGSLLTFWDWASGKKLPEEIRLLEELNHFILSPDGKTVALAAQVAHPGRILLWDRDSKERETLAILGVPVDSLAFSADGKRLTSATLANENVWGQVILWDVAKGRRIREFRHGGRHVALSADGSLAAWVDTEEKKTVVMDVTNKRKPVNIPGHHQSLLFSPDNKTLVAAGQSGIVVFWDLATGKELRRLQGTIGRGRVLRFSADGKLLATASTDWTGQTLVRVWDASSGREIHPLPAHDDHITCVAVSPDGSMIASGSADRTIRLWQAKTGKPLQVLAGHEGDISALVFAADGKTLASAAQDKSVRLWDTASGKERANHAGLAASVLSLAFTPDGRTLRGVAGDGSILSWQGGRSKVIKLLVKIRLGLAALAPDGGTMLGRTSSDDSRSALRLWQLPLGKPLEEIQLLGNAEGEGSSQCWSAAFSAEGRYLATSESHPSHGQILRLWEVAGAREVVKMRLPSKSKNIAFCADGRLLASTHGEGRTLVWDTATGQKVACFQAQTGPVTCAAFAADGKTIVAGNGDHTLLAWDLGKIAATPDLPRNMDVAELKKAWEELAGDDAPLAYRTVGRSIAAHTDSVPFLGERLRPMPPLKPIEPLIADLNSDKFSVRQIATRELEDMGEAAESALRQALLQSGSLEFRRRIEILLRKLNQSPTGSQLRILRALTVLERTGSKAARDLLQTLAAGASEARQTREARASLERIKAKWN